MTLRSMAIAAICTLVSVPSGTAQTVSVFYIAEFEPAYRVELYVQSPDSIGGAIGVAVVGPKVIGKQFAIKFDGQSDRLLQGSFDGGVCDHIDGIEACFVQFGRSNPSVKAAMESYKDCDVVNLMVLNEDGSVFRMEAWQRPQ